MRQAQASGRTVFLSSHVLSEVQHACDRVGFIRDRRMRGRPPRPLLRALAA